jgi:hypothetical protein
MPSRSREASHLPLGLKARPLTEPLWREPAGMAWPAARSQILTVWSSPLAEARSLPSELKARTRMELPWPCRERNSLPVSASQTLMLLPSPPAAM